MYNNKNAPAIAMGISIKIMNGKVSDSNCEAKIKYSNTNVINNTMNNSLTSFLFSKILPVNVTSNCFMTFTFLLVLFVILLL